MGGKTTRYTLVLLHASIPGKTAFALWLLLLALGQAALLRFTNAGVLCHYQHLALEQWRGHLGELAVLATQAILVVAGTARRRPGLRRGWVLAGAMVLLSAAPSRDLEFYALELAVAGALACVQLANLWLIGCVLPVKWISAIEAGVTTAFRVPGGRAVWAAAAGVAVASAVLNLAAYQNHPHVADELAFLMQGRMLSQGQITLAPPPVPAAFEMDLFVSDPGGWFPCTLPGFPLLLALGFLAGAPWAVNAILAGVNVVLAQRVFLRILEPDAASLATVLFAVSPWNVFLAMSFMSHTAGLTFGLLMAWGICWFHQQGRMRALVLAGMACGALWSIRMLDATALGVLAAVWLLVRARRLPPVLAFAAGFLPPAAMMLVYNARLTGSPFYSPLTYYFDTRYHPGVNRLGFGADVGMTWPLDPFPGHGPADVVVNTVLNLFQLNTELFGWAGGSLALLLCGLLIRRWRREDSVWLGLAGFFPAVYALYWFSGGPDFGARYWHLAIVPLAAWVARTLAERRWITHAAIAALVTWTVFVPWRAVDKYRGYLRMSPELIRSGFDAQGPALVLVRGQLHPDFASAAYGNRLDFQGPVVYAWDRDAKTREAVLAAYPGRRVITVEGPTLTGQGYRVLAAEAGGR